MMPVFSQFVQREKKKNVRFCLVFLIVQKHDRTDGRLKFELDQD